LTKLSPQEGGAFFETRCIFGINMLRSSRRVSYMPVAYRWRKLLLHVSDACDN